MPCIRVRILKIGERELNMQRIRVQGIMLAVLFAAQVVLGTETGIDFETGFARTVYNDVRIPGNTGTKLSLRDDLEDTGVFYYRLRGTWTLNEKHSLSMLIAPLTIRSEGTAGKDIIFGTETFTAGSDIDAVYTFNSYRFTWAYNLRDTDTYEFSIGATLKIRDAKISLESGAQDYTKDDFGFVPLVYFRYAYHLSLDWDFLCKGDALAAPQGRAEDILAAAVYRYSDRVRFRFGLRILEGGADNDEVYTFSMITYAVCGVHILF